MRIKSIVLGFGAVAAAVAMVMAPASAEASVVWSWSFGSSSNGAAGTFTTTDVPDLNNPAGTYSVLQFTLDFLNGNPVSAIDTALSNSPSFVYNSATDYGFINALGFFDSGLQSFNGGGATCCSPAAPLTRRPCNRLSEGRTWSTSAVHLSLKTRPISKSAC